MTKNLMPSIVLSCICIAVAILLAGINMITGPIIEANQNAAANEALLEVLPDGKNFKQIEITEEYPSVVTAGYTADGGTVFQMTVTGKSAGMIIMCGIDSDGKIVATKVIANEETPSYAQKVFPNVEGTDSVYAGMELAGFEPYLVSGATLTSKAYGEAIKAALQAAIAANEDGSVLVDANTSSSVTVETTQAEGEGNGRPVTYYPEAYDNQLDIFLIPSGVSNFDYYASKYFKNGEGEGADYSGVCTDLSTLIDENSKNYVINQYIPKTVLNFCCKYSDSKRFAYNKCNIG